MRSIFPSNSILLTGATGFVGSQLLTELLDQTHAPIICLIRAEDELATQRRGRELANDPRVSFVRADLQQERLGLADDTWHALARSVSEIYHCAASICFDLPLAEAQSINVDGTRRLLDIATQARSEGTFARFHHISTAYAAGTIAGTVSPEYLPEDRPWLFRNTYERTKARAERLLRSQSEVPVTIYRPSIIAGDTQSGATDNWNILYAPMRMIHRGLLPVLRTGGSARLDLVGVDYVVKGILALAQSERRHFSCYHVTAGEQTVSISQFVQTTVERSRIANADTKAHCRAVDPVQWAILRTAAKVASLAPMAFNNIRRWGWCAKRGFCNFSMYEPYTEVETIFESAYETEVIAAAGIVKPTPLQYLRTITDYAISVDFGCKPTDSITDAPRPEQAITVRRAEAFR